MLFTAMMLAVLLVMDDTSSCSDCRALGARERIAAANITEIRKTEVHTAGYLLTTYPKYRWFLIGSAVMFMGYNLQLQESHVPDKHVPVCRNLSLSSV